LPTTPQFTVQKTCPATATFSTSAQDIPFSVAITNTGNVTITVQGTDDNAGLGGTIAIGPQALDPGDGFVFNGVHHVPARFCGPLIDNVSITGTGACGGTVTHTATCTTTIPVNPSISLVKVCGPAPTAAGQPIPFTITVKNTGDVTLTSVVITDTVDNGGATQTKTDCGDLDPGASCVFSSSNPTSTADCDKDVTDTATVNAVDICTQKPVTATQPCTVHVPPCIPHISITKQVACFLPGNTCGTYGPTATGTKDDACPAFCWQVTITNTDPSVPVGSLVVTDTAVPADQNLTSQINAAAFAPYPIAPGDTRTATVTADPLCSDTVNTVNATPFSGPNATGASGPTVSASANAVVKQIQIACSTIITSDMNLDMPVVDNHVTLPAGSVNAPITVTLCLSNNGTADELVTAVTGLPALVLCSDDTTPVDINAALGLPMSLKAGASTCTTLGCWLVTCNGNTGGSFSPSVTVIADTNETAVCVYDKNGAVISTSISGKCPVSVSCLVPTSCRTTGGGTMYNCDTSVDCVTVTTVLRPSSINVSGKTLTLDHVSHGGQLGAPYSQQDCATILADQCIRGEWQHNRHYSGPNNPTDVYAADFHTAGTNAASHPIFDTLLCECLGCCSADGTKRPAVIGSLAHNGKFFLCNPDDHKVCGPMPRPAPDNALIWTGIGSLTPANTTPGNQKTANYAILRVYVEDRSEPGGFHPKGSVMPADVYVFQAWDTGIPITGKKPDPNNLGISKKLGNVDVNVFRSTLSQDSCTFIQSIGIDGPCPAGSLPSDTILGIRADVSDAGSLHSGNQQIHPSTGATCPGPGGIPAPAPGTPNTSACVNPTNCTNP
jgi:uncharacterized repeat protein (TIGR01451 family)